MTEARNRTTVAAMQCAVCGTELIAGKQFCHHCGAAAGMSCRQCGAALSSGFRFCPDCGTAVIAAAQVPPTAASPDELAAPLSPAPAPEPDRAMPEHLAQKILANRHAVEGER
ncbi:MAG TPA: zinc ribbon domain-containing protein, partial [Terriglobales bacterium]|nr:zinc ribbon domain-containing protein [Terriglobales bacterium]